MSVVSSPSVLITNPILVLVVLRTILHPVLFGYESLCWSVTPPGVHQARARMDHSFYHALHFTFWRSVFPPRYFPMQTNFGMVETCPGSWILHGSRDCSWNQLYIGYA